ncbi:MAG: sel1 repeat family protein [Kiritimatiellae bacterium]|nr:sel1 repeat family protein [Kiritimatiellia bacterium]
MVFEIERDLASALYSARVSGDAALARSCELTAVRDSTGAWSLDVKAETEAAAFAELHRMVNDPEVPLERARQIRLYLAWKGHVESQFTEGENFRTGRNIVQDFALARYWLGKAAERGHYCAQNNLGVLYAEGLGGKKDLEKAVYWYIKSADGGDGVAMGNLGMHLIEGSGVRRNYRQAAKLLKEGLKANPYSARTHEMLAACYEHGVAGRNGLRLAIHHYQEASDFGSLKARAALCRLAGRVARKA